MADRHGEFVPDVPVVQAGEWVQCSAYVECKRRDGHLGACLPSPIASILGRATEADLLLMYADGRGDAAAVEVQRRCDLLGT